MRIRRMCLLRPIVGWWRWRWRLVRGLVALGTRGLPHWNGGGDDSTREWCPALGEKGCPTPAWGCPTFRVWGCPVHEEKASPAPKAGGGPTFGGPMPGCWQMACACACESYAFCSQSWSPRGARSSMRSPCVVLVFACRKSYQPSKSFNSANQLAKTRKYNNEHIVIHD